MVTGILIYTHPYFFQDIQWGDIDYMNASKDWTYDQENYGDLPSVIEDLHNNQQRYIIIVVRKNYFLL